MQVHNKRLINEFMKKHADVRDQLAAWLYEVEGAYWDSPKDILQRYASASIINNDRVVFNIKGNSYRLDAKINFRHKILLVKRIGTHAEYDRWEF